MKRARRNQPPRRTGTRSASWAWCSAEQASSASAWHWSDARSACPNATCPSASAATTGNSAANDAKTAADISTVAFVAGGVALAAGAIVFFTPPSGPPKAGSVRVLPLVGWGSAGVSLSGAL
jgi:hypothetical protein